MNQILGWTSPTEDEIVEDGRQAFDDLKKTFDHWIRVGKALEIGRSRAMRMAGVNRPTGRGYNMVFGDWLMEQRLDKIDKSDRARLFEVMDNLTAILRWRQTLPLTQQLRLNHPATVVRKWRATSQPKAPREGPTPFQKLHEEIADLKDQLRAVEDDDGGNTYANDTPKEIARSLFGNLNRMRVAWKAKAIATELNRLHRENEAHRKYLATEIE